MADTLTTALIERLILEDHELTDAEVVQCLELIYSHLVNKFQGDLAEAAATELCSSLERQWKSDGLLPRSARYIAGTIMEMSRSRHIRYLDKDINSDIV